jgi:pimeloyl-ACP methyl ester carboxylesterase
MPVPTKLLFLPGASGNTSFWHPVAKLLAHGAEQVHAGWPGFGPTPPDAGVNSLDDLVASVVAEIDGPTAIIAQSMGGIVALRAALAKPELVTHVVLTVTSGGIDISDLGAQDWRPSLLAAKLPDWFAGDRQDLSARLGEIKAPVLLLWGDADPISPVAVGVRLASLFPTSALHVVAGGAHDLASVHAALVAPLIDAHLLFPAQGERPDHIGPDRRPDGNGEQEGD